MAIAFHSSHCIEQLPREGQFMHPLGSNHHVNINLHFNVEKGVPGLFVSMLINREMPF